VENSVVRFLVFFLAIGFTSVAWAQPRTTRSALTAGRIGTPADLHGTVALYNRDDRQIECSGVLIAPDLVLTAAHCVVELADDDDPLGPYPPERFSVIAGEIRPDLFDDTHHYDIDTIVSHGDFMVEDIEDPVTGLGNVRDIALLFLVEPVMDMTPTPLMTPSEALNRLEPGAAVVLTGFGVHDLNTLSDGVLHLGAASVSRRLRYEMLVGGGGEADTCVGDSGGPVYAVVEGEYQIAGLASRGPDDSEVLCGDGTIAVVVPSFYDWIVDSSAGRMSPTNPPSIDGRQPGSQTSQPPRCNCTVDAAQPGPFAWLFGLIVFSGVARRRSNGVRGLHRTNSSA